MKKYLSQNDLEKFYRKEIRTFGKEGIQEKISKKRTIYTESNFLGNIFLSHSHIDKTIVNKISLLFDKINTELYIDWLDKSMPEKTNIETATTIKNKINNSKKFLFLATYHGLRSRWCNWELGIADALKKSSNLAILPIESKSVNWRGSEYLQLYPEMKLEIEDLEDLNEQNIFIHSTSGEVVSLINWLSN
jgi:hypothetical protein